MANYKTYRIGDVVELCTETNSDLKYGLEHVRGISNTKEIQQTKANLIERNLAPFHVVRRNEFVYNRRTSRNGERVGLGFNNTDETLLITEDYVHFRVKDENQLNPDYLYLFFKRDEFDREARYNSLGSATEFFNWDDMQAIKINVPPIEEQRRIVSEYQTVERRIQNNELLIKKLEETAQAIYHHTFVEGIDEENLPEGWRMGCLGEVANIKGGKRLPKGEELIDVPTSHPYIRVADMVDGMIVRLQSDFLYVEEIVYPDISRYIVNEGDIIISIVGTIGKINIIDASLHNANLTENCYKIASDINPYIYCFLKSSNGAKRIEEGIVGGVQAKLPLYNVEAIKIPIPTNDVIKDFNNKFSTIENNIKLLSRETSHLRTLLSLLTSKLS